MSASVGGAVLQTVYVKPNLEAFLERFSKSLELLMLGYSILLCALAMAYAMRH